MGRLFYDNMTDIPANFGLSYRIYSDNAACEINELYITDNKHAID